MQHSIDTTSAALADTPSDPNAEVIDLVSEQPDASKYFNTSGTYVSLRYSAKSPFVIRKQQIQIPYNLTLGSAIRYGKPRDGSSIGDSPVIMPWEDNAVFDARAFLTAYLERHPDMAAKARLLCSQHHITLETLVETGPGHVIWIDSSVPFRTYGDRSSFPILKALLAKQSFVILQGKKGCGVVNGSFDNNFFDRLLELEAISMSVITLPEGLLVPAPRRLILCLTLVILAIVTTVLAVIFDDRPNFIERFESATFVLALILLTVPAIVSLFSSEPNLMKNTVRGKKILTKQSQVTNYFKLSQRDYAMLATRTKGSKLVSKDIGCFLTGTERGTHFGDVPVVQCEDLAYYGVICGQSVHYRANWQTVRISNRLGANRTHLTNEPPKVKYWCAGVREDTWVGFAAQG